MEYISNVYFINLDESKERLEDMQNQLKKIGNSYIRIPAINGKKLSIEEVERQSTFMCRYMCTSSMIGCFLSHKKAWETMIQNGDSYAIIMEDDCELVDSFQEDLKMVLDELIPHNPDWIYLGCFGKCDKDNNQNLFTELHTAFLPKIESNNKIALKYSYVPEAPLGTHCYIISNSCARKLVEIMNKASYHVDIVFLSNANKFNVFASNKKLGFQFTSAEKSTQSTYKFPVTLNYITDKIHDNNNISYSFYFSSPLCEILWHPVNLYFILACLIAIFIPDTTKLLYFYSVFFILEYILQSNNINIIIHWMFFIYMIIYLRIRYRK